MDTNDRSVSLVSKAKVKDSERTPKQIQGHHTSSNQSNDHFKPSVLKCTQKSHSHTSIPKDYFKWYDYYGKGGVGGRSLKLCPSTNKPETDLKQLDPSWV
jgi:hypothetical protein